DALYIDGDDLHPPANIAKMAAGLPLTDADRWPWLDAVGARLATARGPILVGCSALKRAYRDRIRAHAGAEVIFVHLSGSAGILAARMASRPGHFMPAHLLESQLATLEPLGADERGGVIDIDQPLADMVTAAVHLLRHRSEP
ncbi:MAG: gluconokinase, partial [Pseudomonadota bacterium]